MALRLNGVTVMSFSIFHVQYRALHRFYGEKRGVRKHSEEKKKAPYEK